MNQLLIEQVQKNLGKIEVMPKGWDAFLQGISEVYDRREKESDSKEKPGLEIRKDANELSTKLKNEAKELKLTHRVLGRILNSVNFGFFSRNISNDHYTYLSVACEKIYGYSVKEFFENTRLWYEVIHPEDRSVVERDNERLNKKEQVYTQYRIIRKDKSTRWIESTIIPFFRNGKLTRVDGVVNDITKRKEVETEREAMLNELVKTNNDLKQFSYITSHNLRSPLSNIQAILNLFQFDENDGHNRQILEMLQLSTKQLNTTIDDLNQILLIKNHVNSDLVSLKLEDAFNRVLQTFTNALNEINGKIWADFKAPFVRLNKVYLESIFINLISNAIKYRSLERTLLIQVESFDEPGGCVKIKFSDNGIGIDLNKHKDKVFGLYQRFNSNIEGRGLGLFIMKTQIEATGGKIVVESEPGVGTTFILTLRS